jgi:hypothetical protein
MHNGGDGGDCWLFMSLLTVAAASEQGVFLGVSGALAFGDNGCGEPICAESGQLGICCWHPAGTAGMASASCTGIATG